MNLVLSWFILTVELTSGSHLYIWDNEFDLKHPFVYQKLSVDRSFLCYHLLFRIKSMILDI